MVAWLLVAALLEVAPVLSASTGSPLSRLGGKHSSEGSTSAVLSATGAGYLESKVNSDSSEPTTPTCAEPCDDYLQGVDQDTEAVCIDAFRTCGNGGCGMGLCVQRFNDDCTDYCSEWADADPKTLNVCQDKDDFTSYKCTGEKVCNKDSYRCKQKRIEDCFLFCEGYEFSGDHVITQDSEYVCQNIDADQDNFGVCMPLPCSMQHHNSGAYRGSSVCRQQLPACKNSCAAGSDEPNATTVCFDEYSEKCENWEYCPMHMVRCQPTKVHQDLSNVDTGSGAWSLTETARKAAEKRAKASGKPLTQAEWKAEQQRVRIEHFRKEKGLDQILQGEKTSPKTNLMRSDGS